MGNPLPRIKYRIAGVEAEMAALPTQRERAAVWQKALVLLDPKSSDRTPQWARMLARILILLLVLSLVLRPSHMTVVVLGVMALHLLGVWFKWLGTAKRRRLFRAAIRLLVRERGVPLCLRCGYNLTGSVLPRCPECGREFDPAALTTASTLPEVAQ